MILFLSFLSIYNIGKQFLTLTYDNIKSVYQSYSDITNVIKTQYDLYVKMNNKWNPNGKPGNMCNDGLRIIVGDASEQVVKIMENLVNLFGQFKDGLEKSLSS